MKVFLRRKTIRFSRQDFLHRFWRCGPVVDYRFRRLQLCAVLSFLLNLSVLVYDTFRLSVDFVFRSLRQLVLLFA